MFGKETLVQMFQNLPTSRMISALSNAGVNVSESLFEESDLLDDLRDEDTHLWSDFRVPLWSTDNRPRNLLDPSKIVELNPVRTRYEVGSATPNKNDLFTEDLMANAQGGM